MNAMSNDDDRLYELKEAAIDYFAIFIYLFQNNPEIINDIVQQFMEFYNDIKGKEEDENQQRIIRSLYRELKLYSCWINIFPNLEEINKPLIDLLKRDFYEPTFPNRVSIPSLFEQYGFPENSISRLNRLWYLHPSYMWGNRFQNEISEKLNGKEGEIYKEFHEMLKK
jgi:hypothetical protein